MALGAPKKDGRRAMLSEINVTPMVDVMLVLLIIFMISSSVQTLEMQYERQTVMDTADEKLEEAEALLMELEQKKKQNTKVEIDLPRVDSDVVKLSEVKKLKLEVDDKLRFSIDGTLLVDCLKISPDMQRFMGRERVENEAEAELAAFDPCLKLLGEKMVDNKKLQEDKELYVLASRGLNYGQVLRAAAIGIVSIVGMAKLQHMLPGRAGIAAALYGNTMSAGFLISALGTGVWASAFGYWSLFGVCLGLSAIGAVAMLRPERAALSGSSSAP